MGKRDRRLDDEIELAPRQAYYSCKRKIKLKSSEASRKGARFNQRKYLCDLCGHWHLTKQKVYNR